MTRYPWGYGVSTKTLDEIEAILAVHYHPEYLRRLLAWLEFHDGKFGIGGHWRAGGAQPDKPGFAPEGKSFHQDQSYADGVTAACAVDLVARNDAGLLKRVFSLNGASQLQNPNTSTVKRLVSTAKNHRSPYWSEVPAQGTAEARRWGLHCNVGTPPNGEPWHMQPTVGAGSQIDGWQSWWNAGRPAPVPGYPLPTDPTPPGDDDMATAVIWRDPRYIGSYLLGVGVPLLLTPELKAHYRAIGVPEVEDEHDELLAQCEMSTGYTPVPKG